MITKPKPAEAVDRLQANQKPVHRHIFDGKPDHEIWSAFKAGDEIAFVHIYNRYFNMLFRYGSQFSRDRNLIKDAIQDLFMELLRKREKLSGTTSIKYYLLKSLKVNLISKLKRNKLEYCDEMHGFRFGLTISMEERLINMQLDEEKRQRIARAIDKLKVKQREIIYYYYFEELNLSEIASIMNFSNPKSVQNLLYRTLGLLKNYLLAVIVMIFY